MPTSIEWTEETWNPVTGCSKVSPGCDNCYAETLSLRHGWSTKPWAHENAGFNVVLHPERLEKPLSWRKPRVVFVNSMSDLFHEEISFEFIDQVYETMCLAPQHVFQVLTKRPERALEYYRSRADLYSVADPQADALANVWLGVSIENARYTWRADVLREIPAAVRFISAEPLLGSLFQVSGRDPDEVLSSDSRAESQAGLNGPSGSPTSRPGRAPLDLTGIDWVIVGGESGPGARAMHPDWARELLDACLAREVCAWDSPLERPAFFFKQWGEWIPDRLGLLHRAHELRDLDGTVMARVGKKRAGRELDGRTWDEFPAREAVPA